MATLVDDLVQDIMTLPLQQRAYIVDRLLQSLDAGADSQSKDEWAREIEKRSNEVRNGVVNCRPIQDTIADIRGKLAYARSRSSGG